MKRYILIVSLFAFSIIIGCSQARGTNEDAFVAQIFALYPELKEKKYEIVSVKRTVDGDTFETDSGHKVRLIGMNTPEITGKVEFFGDEASRFSRERLTGHKVYMFQDAGDKDKYGRLLRYIFIENEPTMFNETLLIEGYANMMTVPPNVMFADKFARLEREARENNKGLWGKAESNARSSGNQCSEPKIKGNINSRNEKIYHVPGGRNYEMTKPEAVFCTEEEAAAAGFRKAKE